ncbi:hypothetical protein [uncultured Marivirga sp.]|uniref:hypothetical protein n=1 Tax=uncultured Marivirga sp. TaxID=1123707 RepID=UPI0030EF1889|tara:strand:- start:154 stop:639 length:486 start_codon:yes stop_codon:yes gene_type:complete
MKLNQILTLSVFCLAIISCATLQPATAIKNGDIKDYKYIYISHTKSLTSSTGASVSGQYYSTSKSVNPRDVITGILAKQGYILIPELKDDISSETLIINYGESGRRSTGLGGYTIEVTIQFISSSTTSLVCSCTAEGQGSTEADDIREAITRCLNKIIKKE